RGHPFCGLAYQALLGPLELLCRIFGGLRGVTVFCDDFIDQARELDSLTRRLVLFKVQLRHPAHTKDPPCARAEETTGLLQRRGSRVGVLIRSQCAKGDSRNAEVAAKIDGTNCHPGEPWVLYLAG
ncbi:MAG: hypothetical protein V3W02_05650, partial [Gammaproteobacteria bacterium]